MLNFGFLLKLDPSNSRLSVDASISVRELSGSNSAFLKLPLELLSGLLSCVDSASVIASVFDFLLFPMNQNRNPAKLAITTTIAMMPPTNAPVEMLIEWCSFAVVSTGAEEDLVLADVDIVVEKVLEPAVDDVDEVLDAVLESVASSASIICFCSANMEQFPFVLQLNPKGQHPEPQVNMSLESSVVLMRLSGCAVAFCCSMSQEMGLWSEQSLPAGQHRIVKLAPRDRQTWSEGQQKLLGRPACWHCV
jgi:hypothetical protein